MERRDGKRLNIEQEWIHNDERRKMETSGGEKWNIERNGYLMLRERGE